MVDIITRENCPRIKKIENATLAKAPLAKALPRNGGRGTAQLVVVTLDYGLVARCR